MKLDTYNDILQTIRTVNNRRCIKVLREKYPSISAYTLGSIYSLDYQRKMKRNHQRMYGAEEQYYKMYMEAIKAGEGPGILLKLADHAELSPSLVARLILDIHYGKTSAEDSSNFKSSITRLMRDTTLIEDKNLSYEVYLCVLYDDQYGPISDNIKHSLGQEYELRLQRNLKELNIAFKDEDQLRAHGYDKTPDIRLEVPIAVDGFVVNWIESKALFADEEAHKNYLKDQYLSYWNRFGPGMVIYWFGFVDIIDQHNGKQIILRDSFPSNITFMNPQCIEPT